MAQRLILGAALAACALLLPQGSTFAYGYQHDWNEHFDAQLTSYEEERERLEKQFERTKARLLQQLAEHERLLEERAASLEKRACARLARLHERRTITRDLPSMCAGVAPAPEPAPEPEPVHEGDPEPQQEPIFEPEPAGTLVISEVLYDLANDGSQGSEAAGRHEWVELYNGTGSEADLAGYALGDSTGSDPLAADELLVPAGGHVLVVATSTTLDYWSIPTDAMVVVVGSSLGANGLANAGDAVYLYDDAHTTVDAMSYGANGDVFPANSLASAPGRSLARTDVGVDTDTAADWDAMTPTPGR